MNLQKILLNVFVSCSLISLIYCGSTKPVVENSQNVLIEKEVNYIPYYLKVYEADSLYLVGNYERSFEILDSLFIEFEPLNQLGVFEMETYIKTCFLTENYQNIKPIVIKLVSEWGYEEKVFLSSYDTVLPLAWSVANLKYDEVIQLRKLYADNINWSLRDTLIVIGKADQLYRGKDRDEKIKREDSIDLVHIDLLKYIFKKYEYPSFKKVGYPTEKEPTDLEAVYNHISDNLSKDEYSFFRKLLLNYIKDGTAMPNYLASLVDKKLLDEERKTYYGTLIPNGLEIDTMEVNNNRKSIGLPNLGYYEFKWDKIKTMLNL